MPGDLSGVPKNCSICSKTSREASTSGDAKKSRGTNVRVPTQLTLQYLVCSPEKKLEILVKYIRDSAGEKGIVYLLTCACVEFCAKALKGCGLQGSRATPV